MHSKIYDGFVIFRTTVIIQTPTLEVGHVLKALHTCRQSVPDVGITRVARGVLSSTSCGS